MDNRTHIELRHGVVGEEAPAEPTESPAVEAEVVTEAEPSAPTEETAEESPAPETPAEPTESPTE